MLNYNQAESNSEVNADQNPETPDWNALDTNPSPDGVSGAQDDYAGPSASSRLKYFILPAVCVLALAGIYLWGLKNHPAPSAETGKSLESQVDKALARLTGNLAGRKLVTDAEQMVRTFNSYPANQQVDSSQLQKNPFTLSSQQGALEASAVTEAKGPSPEEIRQALGNKLTAMKLQSIIQNKQGGACMIDGEIYRPGMVIKGEFSITKINVNSVEVQCGDQPFVLTL